MSSEKYNEKAAYEAGREGRIFHPKNQEERRAFESGQSARGGQLLRDHFIDGFTEIAPGVKEQIINPLVRYIPFFFIAYSIATYLFHKPFLYYFNQAGGDVLYPVGRLCITTYILTYFLISLAYYFRGRMLFLKNKNDEKWKITDTVLRAILIYVPLVILIFQFFKLVVALTHNPLRPGELITYFISVIVLIVYLLKHSDENKIENVTKDINKIYHWAYEWGYTGNSNLDSNLPIKLLIVAALFYFLFYR